MSSPFSFYLPPELSAKEPPERRGLARDKVRLMVIDRASQTVEHARFDALGKYLRAGDLLVFNSSRTLPAALEGCGAPEGPCIEIRLAEHLPDGAWRAAAVPARRPFLLRPAPPDADQLAEELTGTVEARDERIRAVENTFLAIRHALVDCFTDWGCQSATSMSPRLGPWTITRPSMRESRARLRCPRRGALSPGSCFSS